MLFGLKNVGAMYQRHMDKVFKYLICNTMDIYVDDGGQINQDRRSPCPFGKRF